MTLPDDGLQDHSALSGTSPPGPGDCGEASSSGASPDGWLTAAVHRRLTVAVCWAVSRRAALDGRELYEDSFALNEEFREWLLCLEDHPRELQASVLMVPRDLARWLEQGRRPETDGLLEI